MLVRLHVDTRLIWPSVPNLSDCTSATTTGCVLLQPNFMSMWKDVVFHLIDKMCKEYLNEWMSTLIKIWSYDKDYNAYNQKNLVVNTFKLTDYEILLMKLTTNHLCSIYISYWQILDMIQLKNSVLLKRERDLQTIFYLEMR